MNYTAKVLSFELAGEGFIVIPIHPGAVLTDMLQIGIDMAEEPIKEYVLQIALIPEVVLNRLSRLFLDSPTKILESSIMEMVLLLPSERFGIEGLYDYKDTQDASR